MIIEGAFLKLPEVLLSYGNNDDLYEAHIVSLLTNAIVLEFNARNIDNPLAKMQLEKRYDNKQNARCDLYTNFDFLTDNQLQQYGYYIENWIEVKYFGGLTRNKGNETKSENAGSIIADIHRLANSAAAKDSRGLYLLVVFNQNPDKYLAFSRKDKSERKWLRALLKPGINVSMFSSIEEPSSIMKPFSGVENVSLSMVTRTLLFEPYFTNHDIFWGYLIQLLDFSLSDDKRYNWGFKSAYSKFITIL
jgi:hypothetical protein